MVKSNDPVLQRLPAREAEIGEGFKIRRALPGKERRMVGAWCFLDHAGPVDYAEGKGLNVGPHPHIGLQTFTWMIAGEILHRDSLGHEQWIRPGQVNLMTAGNGISHAEESAPDGPGHFHAAQLWIALPDRERHREPAFHHYPAMPVVERGGFRITVLAGGFAGERSPAMVYSPLVGLDLEAGASAATKLPLDPVFEHAAMTLEGAPRLDGETLEPGSLLYLGTGRKDIELASDRPARLLLIGGEPFGESVLLWWNFVGRTAEEMEQATRDWVEGSRFGKVHGALGKPLVAPDPKGLRMRAE